MRHEPATAVQSAKRIVICLVSFQASVTEEATIPSLPLFSITEQGGGMRSMRKITSLETRAVCLAFPCSPYVPGFLLRSEQNNLRNFLIAR